MAIHATDSTSPSFGAEAGSDSGNNVSINAGDDSSSDSGSGSGAESESSSVVYGQESFATFSLRVQALAQNTVWPGAAPGDIVIERLRGGGYNRIIGLTRRRADGTEPDAVVQYILRVPRFDSSQVGNDVAALHFLHRYTTIATPKVIRFDDTDQNELGSPFIIQNRLPGTPLLSTYPNLTHAQRCRVAHELGTVFASMLAVEGGTAGVFVLPSDKTSQDAQVDIKPLFHEDSVSSSPEPFSNSAATTTVIELLTGILQSTKDACLASTPQDTFRAEYIDCYMAMASELDEDGWFVNHHYSLTHLDFAPRNILVNPTSDARLPIISGIVDWDSAILAPMFMSCKPPLWLWGWKHDEDEDERTANDEPPTAESREIKKLFEDAAGPDYLRFAYQPAYRLARQLVSFIINGIRSNEDVRESDAMLKEWEAIRKAGV
ncbi:hypothetical protein F5X98DRAFT_389428 [Xylaria grammica]|nr:hypothetical protein F5X98DRAFT_389428 [Xylaria grammica]